MDHYIFLTSSEQRNIVQLCTTLNMAPKRALQKDKILLNGQRTEELSAQTRLTISALIAKRGVLEPIRKWSLETVMQTKPTFSF